MRSGSGMPAVSRWADDGVGPDAGRVDGAGCDALGDAAHGAGDLLAAAVVEGDDEDEAVVVGVGQDLRLVEQRADVRHQAGALADDAHPHAVAVEVGEILADEALQQPHQVGDLLDGAGPVLGREAVDREVADPEVGRRLDGRAQGLDATAVAFEARHAAGRGPTPVAVHDDADMGRDAPRLPGPAGSGSAAAVLTLTRLHLGCPQHPAGVHQAHDRGPRSCCGSWGAPRPKSFSDDRHGTRDERG